MGREQHYAAQHYRTVTQIGATFYSAKVSPNFFNPPAELRGAYTEVCCPDCNKQLQWRTKRRYQKKPIDIWRCPKCNRLFALLM